MPGTTELFGDRIVCLLLRLRLVRPGFEICNDYFVTYLTLLAHAELMTGDRNLPLGDDDVEQFFAVNLAALFV